MEHIKRCYLIPAAVGLALLIFHGFVNIFLFKYGDVFLFRDRIEVLLFWPIVLAFAILCCMGIAESILVIINRRTVTSTVFSIAFLAFVFHEIQDILLVFLLMLSFVGAAGAVSAFFNGRTVTAIISGVTVLVSALSLAYPVFARSSNLGDFGGVAELVKYLFFVVGSIFAGVGILAVAFITHTNMALSKLRILYLITPILLVSFQLYFFVEMLIGTFGPFELHMIKQASLQVLQFLIVAGCIVMGINRIIYPNDANIYYHKDSLEL